uniref:Immunoglobulin superfamily member 1-like n=1 Tax=Mastacembelus armatus TaxID=205130 RepID=A0A3Q3LP34_9TELE
MTAINNISNNLPALPVPSLQLQSKWLEVFPSEKVKFICNVSRSSDWNINWIKDGQPIKEPNLSLSAEKSVLTITAATQTDSGNYGCEVQHKTKLTKTLSNSLLLKVHGDTPKPTLTKDSKFALMFPGESLTFTCAVSDFPGAEYLWYHNGKEIPQSAKNTYTIDSLSHSSSGQYHCKAKRGDVPFSTQESEKISLQITDPPTPSLKLLSSWLDVFEDETVQFSCKADSEDWMFEWYQNQTKLQENPDLSLDVDGSFLNITAIPQRHQGVYACKARHKSRKVSSEFSNTLSVSVYGNTPKPTLKKDYGYNVMYVGERVRFTCTVDVASGWTYQWYKDGKELSYTTKNITIPLGLSDGGKYSCKAARGATTLTGSSEEIPLEVHEIPVPSLKQITLWLDVFPTEGVKLSCGMNSGSGWTYTWYRDDKKVASGETVSFDSNGATLSIGSASAERAGQYKCKGHLQDRSVVSSFSSGLKLTVYGVKPTASLTRDPDYTMMFLGEPVTFRCHVNVSSGWEYLWYKDNNQLNLPDNIYQISSVELKHSGTYRCQAKRGSRQAFQTDSSRTMDLQVQKTTPKPSITQQPDAKTVYVGELVSFDCKVEISSGWTYHWFKDEKSLAHHSGRLDLQDADLMKSGSYKCMATRDKTKYNTTHSDSRVLNIVEIPFPSLKQSTKWLDVFPTEAVKLNCGMQGSSDWTYTWYKDGQEIQAGAAVSFDPDHTTLSISSASALHHGQYTCTGKLKFKGRSVKSGFSSGLKLHVYDAKPKVTLMRTPADELMHTGDLVSFSCHVNISSGWEYLWYKGDHPLTVSGNNYIISSAVTADTGSYTCAVKRGKNTVFKSSKSQPVKIQIEERPQAKIVLLTGWSEVFSTDSLVLKCEVEEYKDTWNYTWFKERQGINSPSSEKYVVTPKNDPEQSQYSCQGIRNERPFYSRSSDSLTTKNLLLKRRVLLSISGCIFFGIIAVFIGCIVLRLIRKPVDDDDKTEEANLFLSMAQLKNCSDAPCPLVEYITDAEINASPKAKEEENGTICSETTPLPITVQEEEAVKTASDETEANNAGLVSFKQ